MLYFLAGIVVGALAVWWLSQSNKSKHQNDVVRHHQPEPFKVPAAVADMYEELESFGYDDPVEHWAFMRHGGCFEDQKRYKVAKSRFMTAIRNRKVPPEWAQTVVGGFLLEYITSSTIIGLAAGGRALKYARVARWMKEQLESVGLRN